MSWIQTHDLRFKRFRKSNALLNDLSRNESAEAIFLINIYTYIYKHVIIIIIIIIMQT